MPGPGAEQIEEGNPDAEEGAAHGLGHAMQAPPSTAMYCPVMCREASEARKATVPFRSSSPPSRPRGVAAITDFSIFSSRPRDWSDTRCGDGVPSKPTQNVAGP